MTDRERHEDETLKNCIQEAYGCSDDQLLAELAEIDKTLSESDLPGVEDRIMSRLKARMAEEETSKEIEVNSEADKVSVAQVEETESAVVTEVETAPCAEVPEKKVVRIGKKKIALVAVLAAAFVGVLGGTTIGGNNYFLKRDEQKQGIVLDSGKNEKATGNLDEAYKEAEKQLGISILKMNYIPKEMLFECVNIVDYSAIFKFSYNNSYVYFIQSKESKEISIGINSDRNEIDMKVYNKWLNQDISIESETLENGEIGYSATVYEKDVSYRIIGKMSEEEIKEILKYLNH